MQRRGSRRLRCSAVQASPSPGELALPDISRGAATSRHTAEVVALAAEGEAPAGDDAGVSTATPSSVKDRSA
jgi:hypothetical protein